MKTPICDFIEKYRKKNTLRLHMPAHKGVSFIGCEGDDITEITGADSLYEASGIIAESEQNASYLFGSKTCYSTEGSSQCIRAMIYLVKLLGDAVIFASRNAHKSFITAVALTDADTEWLTPSGESYLESGIDLDELDSLLGNCKRKTKAVYITSPDYLGNIAPIVDISKVCKKHNALLLVDNAHGAYLKFLPESLHPIDLGADICCDSAHKTLPVLTGGAYLHISNSAPYIFKERAKDALALFGSTSPSYIILQSLDNANKYIYNGYIDKLNRYVGLIDEAKSVLASNGYSLKGDEPLKLVISAREYGYNGDELAGILDNQDIVCEFFDRDHIVFMFSPENGEDALTRLVNALTAIKQQEPIKDIPPRMRPLRRALTPREAIFAESIIIDASESEGCIFAGMNIACPPAVPLAVAGEIIDRNAVNAFKYYGIEKCRVIKNKREGQL